MKDWDNRRVERAVTIMNERHSFRVSGELRVFLIALVWDYLSRKRGTYPLFTIDEWTPAGSLVRTIATANEFKVALRAYDAAVETFPGADIKLRNGIRVVRSNEERK